MKKRIISCILTVLILASVLPANAFADSSVIHRQIHINPLYKDVVDQKQLFSTLNRGCIRTLSRKRPGAPMKRLLYCARAWKIAKRE